MADNIELNLQQNIFTEKEKEILEKLGELDIKDKEPPNPIIKSFSDITKKIKEKKKMKKIFGNIVTLKIF